MSTLASSRKLLPIILAFALLSILEAQPAPQSSSTCSNQSQCPWRVSVEQGFCSNFLDGSSEDQIRHQLYPNILVNKCPCQNNAQCTEVGGLQSITVTSALLLQSEYTASLVLTGGSELDHHVISTYSHPTGYKVDLVDTDVGGFLSVAGLLDFVNTYFNNLGYRGDGCQIWGQSLFSFDPGPQFAYELGSCGSILHIDIAFPPDSIGYVAANTTGSGTGQVTSTPGVVSCTMVCGYASFTRGLTLSLLATPDPNSVFVGWTGCDPTTDQCSAGLASAIFVDQTKTITAEFDDRGQPPPDDPTCWAPTPTGWTWICPGAAPFGGGTPPAANGHCWQWNPASGSWLAVLCGGNCVSRNGTPSVVNFAGCHPAGVSSTSITSGDPNDKVGSIGAGNNHYIAGATPLRYAIFFGNEPTASGAAQNVVVTDAVTASVDDLRTFGFGPLSFGNQVVTPPPGTSFSTVVDLRPSSNLMVGIDANLSPETGVITWRFASLDPSTHLPTTDPTAGFLPPGGNGSVSFTIMPKQSLPTGTTVQNQATVVFDLNAPINTPTWLNTLDSTPPATSVSTLPAIVNTTSFAVGWGGSDAGSGVATYSVYVSTDGGPFAAWLTNTGLAAANFSGVAGHEYGFYSIATDLVGNTEAPKTTAEARTMVQVSSTCSTDLSSQVAVIRGGFRYNHATKSFVQTVLLTNNGAPLTGASLVLDGLSAAATLNGTGGNTACAAPLGSPWVSIPGTLSTGQSFSMTLTFSDSTQAGIQYSTRVLAGNGQQ